MNIEKLTINTLTIKELTINAPTIKLITVKKNIIKLWAVLLTLYIARVELVEYAERGQQLEIEPLIEYEVARVHFVGEPVVVERRTEQCANVENVAQHIGPVVLFVQEH